MRRSFPIWKRLASRRTRWWGDTGIELAWDDTLRGVPATSLEIVSPAGQVLRVLAQSQAQPGRSLWLTLDAGLQAAVVRIVADAYTQAKDTWAPGSPGASVVVMDVRSGEILAMVSCPTFDNNAYNAFPVMGRQQANALITQTQSDPRHPEVNRPAQGVFALGSVMKTITAAAAADSGVYALDERYMCTGIWNRDIPRVDWLAGGHGLLTLPQSLTQSCNPYYYEAGYQLYMADPDILPDYAARFGFGQRTGIPDIPEEPGFMPNPEWFRVTFGVDMPFSEEVNMAIGQGYVQVTPLQVTRWVSAIANGGTLWTPHLVSGSGLLGETPQPAYTPQATETGLRPEVIDMLHSGMCAVTSTPSGTATFVFAIRRCRRSARAARPAPRRRRGPETPSHALAFASYAPRDNPEIAVVVLVETAGQGSEIAAPIGTAGARNLLRHVAIGHQNRGLSDECTPNPCELVQGQPFGHPDGVSVQLHLGGVLVRQG
jgi:penicillin-binding protein 2